MNDQSGSSGDSVGTAPRISVVIACYNAGATLAAAIESVAAQAREDVELVVIDGNSTDNTPAVIRQHADKIAYWRSESDTGIYDAWNKGIIAARGQYIAFLGADDVWLPGALDAYVGLIAASPEAEYLSSRVQYGEGTTMRIIGQPWDWARFQRYMTVAHVGSLHKRALFDRVGSYDDSFRITGDYELLLRAGPSLRTAFMDKVTVRMGVGGVSSGQSLRVFDETARAKRRHTQLPDWRIALQRWRAIAGYRIRSRLQR